MHHGGTETTEEKNLHDLRASVVKLFLRVRAAAMIEGCDRYRIPGE
jgi:hypothetical protein